MVEIIDWEGGLISTPGIYRGIPLGREYHGNKNLLPGPAVSKSDIKHIAPPSGNPKKFWANWNQNPNRRPHKASKALNFGRLVHCLMGGDEIFDEEFIIRPDTLEGVEYHGNRTVWINWMKEQAAAGLTVVTKADMEKVYLMSHDAKDSGIVRDGALNGDIELSLFARDPKTGIWLKSRPDVMSNRGGDFADLKTAASLEPEFLTRQMGDLGYYIQGALTKMVCDLLQVTFTSFTFVYTYTGDDYQDTDYRILSEEAIATGERVIRYGLDTIRECQTSGQWPGVGHYGHDAFSIGIAEWDKKRINSFLESKGY